jgi:hypothetical protein
MKKLIVILSLLFIGRLLLPGQTTDPLVTKCAMNSGSNTAYLKDFRIQLGKGSAQNELRQKEVFPLSKNMRYRFTLCNADNSSGQLIMKLKDSEGRVQLSTFDLKSGKPYPNPNPYIDFECQKTGPYTLYFDFKDFQQGIGYGIVSLVKSK